jgi:hypothetical protein
VMVCSCFWFFFNLVHLQRLRMFLGVRQEDCRELYSQCYTSEGVPLQEHGLGSSIGTDSKASRRCQSRARAPAFPDGPMGLSLLGTSRLLSCIQT